MNIISGSRRALSTISSNLNQISAPRHLPPQSIGVRSTKSYPFPASLPSNIVRCSHSSDRTITTTATATATTTNAPSSHTMEPQMDVTPPPSTLPLPRILCLHGGGVNAAIFKSQMRAILAHPSLSARYRFVFIDAPFLCAEGIGVKPVYEAWGPYRRWFRWLASHEEVSDVKGAHGKLWEAVREGMARDRGTGDWVGLWGFSQGAKLVCSLLYEQQLCVDRGVEMMGQEGVRWKFGVVLAGRCPFAALSEEGEGLWWLQSAGGLPSEADMEAIEERPDMKLRVPTLHVHGLRDEGLELHRRAVEGYCAPGTTTVVEWDGPHRVPIKKGDVERVVEAFVELVDEYGL